MTFIKLIEETLNNANKPLTVDEIWEKAKEYGYAELLKSKGKTPEKTIGARLYVDIKKDKSIFCQVSKRPAKFFLVNKQLSTHNIDENTYENKTTQSKYKKGMRKEIYILS